MPDLKCGYCGTEIESQDGKLPRHLPCGRGEIAPDTRSPDYIGFVERRAKALRLGRWSRKQSEGPFEKAT